MRSMPRSGQRPGTLEDGVYAGRTAVFATMHGKERAVAPTLHEMLGLTVTVAAGIDTDRLGTFTGEIERPGDMLETARRKARLGMQTTGSSLGMASEGAYGPHPMLPFVASGTELILLIDDERQIEVVERIEVTETNYAARTIDPSDPLEEILRSSRFPEHALVVTPNSPARGADFTGLKAITTRHALRQAIVEMAAASDDGKSLVQTDMRAHLNPTRMLAIADVARKFAERLMCYCPDCDAPGFGVIGHKRGLPCELCNLPTDLANVEVDGCVQCSFETHRPRSDGRRAADPQHCDNCNP